MRAAVRKMGNSSGVIIPRPLLGELGVQAGDQIEMTLERGRIILTPLAQPSRDGWDAAARSIAEAEDEALAWPDFTNEGDEDLKW